MNTVKQLWATINSTLVLMVFVILILTTNVSLAQTEKTNFKFDFGSGKIEQGYTRILPDMPYSSERGYGFEAGAQVAPVDRGTDDSLRSDFCTSDKPFYFSVKLPEGNYKVTVMLGDMAGESVTTIKAELRRLMLENVRTALGKFVTRTFVVNTRTPKISTGGNVRLKPREKTSEWPAWDDKLTIEFNDARPCVCALEITRDDNVPTIYILGDSTVCDQPLEPWNSWGQMLPRFFKPDIVIANHAESGESIRSSLGAGRVKKVMSIIKPGDFLLVQYGHNDMKDRSPNALATYKSNIEQLVTDTRNKGATPVLITSMERKAGVVNDTLGDYPETVRQVAKEENVALIDLHAMSKVLYKALGENIDRAFQDGTHHNNYGSYQLAKCVVEGIKQNVQDLANHIVDDFNGFDPNHPDSIDNFNISASPSLSTISTERTFTPTWESIRDNYEVPEWFRDAKLGIYVHWGVYSVAERGEWYGRRMYQENDPVYAYHLKTYGHPSEFGYKDLIPLWRAENFDPNAWLELFKQAGARYFTPCAVHHDGFDLWDSKYQQFNAAKMGPKKDLIGMLRAATLKHGLRFGVTSHLARSYCWLQTSHGADTKGPKKGVPYDGRLKKYEALYHETHGDTAMRYPAVSPSHWKLSWKLRMLDMIDNYQPDFIYLDGALPFLDDKGQTGFEVLAHYYNEGLKRHGGKKEVMLTYKGSAMTQEKNKGWYVPGIGTRDHERNVPDRMLDEPWQTDDSIGPWGYNTTVPYTSFDQLIDKFVDIVSKNGNLLLNVPPKADGTFDKETIRILKELGKWNRINGEAVFNSRPWIRFGEGPVKAPQSRARISPFSVKDIRFTTRGNILYAILLAWPGEQAVITSMAKGVEGSGEIESVKLLGYEGKLKFVQDAEGLKVTMPDEKPCEYAFVLKITGIKLN